MSRLCMYIVYIYICTYINHNNECIVGHHHRHHHQHTYAKYICLYFVQNLKFNKARRCHRIYKMHNTHRMKIVIRNDTENDDDDCDTHIKKNKMFRWPREKKTKNDLNK